MKTIKVQINSTNLSFTEYSRKLIEQGEAEDTILEFYRGEMLCLYGKIGDASKLTIKENAKEGPVYVKYRPFINPRRVFPDAPGTP